MTDTDVPAADLGAAGIEVDTVADHGADLSVTADPMDMTVSDEESGHVSFLVGGVDSGYAGVVVTVSDDYGGSASADAVLVDGHWVASVDVGGLGGPVPGHAERHDDRTTPVTWRPPRLDPIFLDMSAGLADGDLSVVDRRYRRKRRRRRRVRASRESTWSIPWRSTSA